MSTSASPSLVLHRNRDWLRPRRVLCVLLVLCAVGVGWVTDGLPLPVRGALVASLLVGALLRARGLQRALTLDAEGLRRGSRRWAWSALTSVRPGPRRGTKQEGGLGGLLLCFGGEAVRFGRDWPLEALLVEVLARAPLEAQLARALDQKEREHGLDFGAVWLGPRTLKLRELARVVPLEAVRGVALDGAGLRVELAGEGPLEVPLTRLRDPHVLATLLVRQGSRGSTARVPLTVHSPPPTDATPPRVPPPARSGPSFREQANSVPVPLLVFIFLGGVCFIVLGWGEQKRASGSDTWREVPAEITWSNTWEETRGFGRDRKTVEYGQIRFRFVLDGVEHTGMRYGHGGTDAYHTRRLRVGQQVTAYVPPDKPQDAVLDRDAPGDGPLALMVGLLFMGFPAWACLEGVRSRLRRRRA